MYIELGGYRWYATVFPGAGSPLLGRDSSYSCNVNSYAGEAAYSYCNASSSFDIILPNCIAIVTWIQIKLKFTYILLGQMKDYNHTIYT